jgi:hypothetical protein
MRRTSSADPRTSSSRTCWSISAHLSLSAAVSSSGAIFAKSANSASLKARACCASWVVSLEVAKKDSLFDTTYIMREAVFRSLSVRAR